MLNSSYHRRDAGPPLSDEHRARLERESAISATVIRARGYRTIRRRSEVPDEFADWQRRRGLLVPTYSPDGETRGHQLRPDKPIRRKSGSPPKYETPAGSQIALDCNPLMLEEVRTGQDVLWISEGCKKIDSLASKGQAAVGIIGVWGFAVPGSKSKEPLPCWRHVRLSGRTVIIVYDADARTNANVQEALRRLVVMLEGLGARVLVCYLPAVDGDGKAGVDDFFGAGGTVAEVRLMAAPYKPADVGQERLSRDADFRAAIEDLPRRLREMPVKTIGQNTNAAVVRALIVEAERSGKLVAGGVRVVMDRRTLAERAAKSRRAVDKAIGRLRKEGALRLDNEVRKVEAAGAFILPTRGAQKGGHKGRNKGRKGRQREGAERGSEGRYGPGGHPSARGDQVPALRWSKTILYWTMRDGRRVVAAAHHVARLGEKRGAIVRHVLECGGRAEVRKDLMPRFASKTARYRDFERRVLGPLVEAGILTSAGTAVEIAPDWREALERERREADELEDARRQRQRHKRQREAYRNRDRTPPAEQHNPLRGKEEVRRMVAARAREEKRRWVEEQRQKVGMTAATFLDDEMDGEYGVRFQDAADRWRNLHRGSVSELWRAVHYGPFVFHRVQGALFIDPESVAPSPPEPTPEPERVSKKMPPKVGGVYVHGPECACWLCTEDDVEGGHAGVPMAVLAEAHERLAAENRARAALFEGLGGEPLEAVGKLIDAAALARRSEARGRGVLNGRM